MYAFGNKHSNNSQFQSQNHGGSNLGRGKNNTNRGRGGGRYTNNGGGGQQQQQFYTPHFHQQNYSPAQTSQFGGKNFKGDRPICQIYGKAGHQALDCYHRMDFAYQGKNPPIKLAAMAQASHVALTNNQDPWLANSGTSDHLIANLGNLSVQS